MDSNMIEKIDELTKRNTEYMRNTNVTLNHIRGGITKSIKNTEEEAYNRGANDAWEIARRLVLSDRDIAFFTNEDMEEIFDCDTYFEVLRQYTCREAMDAEKAYREEQEKRKTKEAQTFERGDVVYVKELNANGIYLSDACYYYQVLMDGNSNVAELTKDSCTLSKTGKHIDLSLE